METLRCHYLLLLWVVSHILRINHTRLHIEELTIDVRAPDILLSLSLVVLTVWSLVLGHAAIVLEHSCSWIDWMWHLTSNLRHVTAHLLSMKSTRAYNLLMTTHRVYINTMRWLHAKLIIAMSKRTT